jgi:hypothetical protein
MTSLVNSVLLNAAMGGVLAAVVWLARFVVGRDCAIVYG